MLSKKGDRYKDILEFVRNPIFIFLISVLISIFIVYLSHSFAKEGNLWRQVIDSLSIAILTSGTFGAYFEYYSKKKLMRDVVFEALGQRKALDAGLLDLELKVTGVNSSDEIRNSSVLIVGTRYSSSVLERYRDEFSSRIKLCKDIKIIRMINNDFFLSEDSESVTPDKFFRKLINLNGCSHARNSFLEIYQTESKLCYNFIMSDSGIWIKMYFNERQVELPPAFFVKSGSHLHEKFSHDISLLIQNSKRVEL